MELRDSGGEDVGQMGWTQGHKVTVKRLVGAERESRLVTGSVGRLGCGAGFG